MISELKVSIIVPAYNAEKTIQRCLDSLLSQTFSKEYFEIIVVDDGSLDNTQRIIKEGYKGKVLYIKQENKGPAAARNKGVKYAKGPIVVFTDSDCELEKNWLEEMIFPFQNKEIGGVQGAYKTKQKSIVAKFVQYEIEERYKKMSSQKYIDFLSTYSAAYRRELFLRQGGFNEDYPIASGEDTDFSFRLAKKGIKFLFNPKAICYHLHPESFLKYLKIKFYRGFWRIPLYKKHKDKILKDSYTPFVLKFQVASTFLFLTYLGLCNFLLSSCYIPHLSFLYLFSLFISMLPFMIFIIKKDFTVGMCSPLFIISRTFAFVFGLIGGGFKIISNYIKNTY
jgi:cellulose synthase/poly-beta-1,6-N-acetylglucosamine synthase-like glycosyltransferase